MYNRCFVRWSGPPAFQNWFVRDAVVHTGQHLLSPANWPSSFRLRTRLCSPLRLSPGALKSSPAWSCLRRNAWPLTAQLWYWR
jgi:hypothetical protein